MTTNEATEILAEITRRLTEYEQVVVENARLTAELEKTKRHYAEDVAQLGARDVRLTAELAEARKQPVAFLPTVTGEMIRALPYVNHCQPHEEHEQMADCLNRNIRDAYREAAIERTKPALDVEALARDVWGALDAGVQIRTGLLNTIKDVLRRHVADAPVKPKLDVGVFVDEVAETFDTTGTSWPNGFWTGLGRILREHVEHAAAQLPDELMMDALARVERETQQRTRRECAEMVRRRWAQEEYAGMTDDEFADRMERVK